MVLFAYFDSLWQMDEGYKSLLLRIKVQPDVVVA